MDTQTCEVMPKTERGLMAAFEMVCKRLGRLEVVADHWLRQERDREVNKGGEIDSRLMGWHRDVTLLWQRPGYGPVGIDKTWRAMRISAPDDRQPADPRGEGRLNTEAALARLGVSGKRLWIESRGTDEMGEQIRGAMQGLPTNLDTRLRLVVQPRAQEGGFATLAPSSAAKSASTPTSQSSATPCPRRS